MSEVPNTRGKILRIAVLSILGFIIIGVPLLVLIALNPPWFSKFFLGLLLTAGVPASIILTIKFYKIDIRKFCFGDLSFWSLILANLLTIAIAIAQNWPLSSIVLVYLCQSFTIGIFWFFKILMLKEFSMKDYEFVNIQFKSAKETKLKTAGFFLLHYSFLHIGFLYILLTKIKYTLNASVILMAFVFFLSHCFSFFHNRNWVTSGKPNIRKMTHFPYVRIFPIHMAIFAILDNWNTQWVLVLHLFLRALADSVMYLIEKTGFSDQTEMQLKKAEKKR